MRYGQKIFKSVVYGGIIFNICFLFFSLYAIGAELKDVPTEFPYLGIMSSVLMLSLLIDDFIKIQKYKKGLLTQS